MWKTFTDAFYLNFVADNRWKYLTEGLKTTLIITFFACLMGIVLGFLVGMIRSTYEKTHKLKVLNAICKVYLTVIRGTPVVVQLLIIYFVVFGSVRVDKVIVAILAFGVNSGAYVAEIFRSGIMSIDPGQMEAGRSLGFNYTYRLYWLTLLMCLHSGTSAPQKSQYNAWRRQKVLVNVILRFSVRGFTGCPSLKRICKCFTCSSLLFLYDRQADRPFLVIQRRPHSIPLWQPARVLYALSSCIS